MPHADYDQIISDIWTKTRHHKGKALAKWAKQGKGWKGRLMRWSAIEVWGHHHQIAAQDAHDLKRAHTMWLIYRWARAKVRAIKRQHKPRGGGGSDGTCGVSTGAWGGSQAAGECTAVNVAQDFGLTITSRKRAANDPLSISNPSSDHNEANTTAYAWDIGTFSGASVAVALARSLSISGYSTGNYNSYYITKPWGRFRVQILWAVEGHFNHVHLGIKRA